MKRNRSVEREIFAALSAKNLSHRCDQGYALIDGATSISEVVEKIKGEVEPVILASKQAGVDWRVVDIWVAQGRSVEEAIKRVIAQSAEARQISQQVAVEIHSEALRVSSQAILAPNRSYRDED